MSMLAFSQLMLVFLQRVATTPVPEPPPERTALEIQIVAAIFILVLVLLDLYVFQAIKTAFGKLPALKRRYIYIGYWSLTAITVALLVTMMAIPTPEVSRNLRFVVTGWVSMWVPAKLIVGFFLTVDDLLRLARWVKSLFVTPPAHLAGEKISRSQFITQAALITGSIPVIGTGYGILKGAHDYRVETVEVPIKGLPKAFDGFKILQLSDAHTGSFHNHEAVERGIRLAMDQKADMICFTGDIVNNTADELRGYEDLYKALNAPHGVYSILGNHDYGTYAQWIPKDKREGLVNEVIDVHRAFGWDIMLNEHRIVSKDNASINLIGVENWGTGRFPRKGDLAKAKQGLDPTKVNILLSHDPSHWDAQIRPEHPDIALTMSGHTHGMQFGVEIPGFKWSPVQYRYKQWGGLYTEGDQHIYVNRGFGYIGFPGRVGMPPEITVLVLRPAMA